MSNTLFDKIWDNHVVKNIEDGLDVLYIDRHYIHEVTSPQAFEGIRERGIDVFRPVMTTATADHNIPTINQNEPIKNDQSRKQVEALINNCSDFDIELFGIGHKNNGIVHVIGPELGLTLPGRTIVCGDSHTSTHGAFGAVAFGIGTSQVEQVFASQCLLLSRPKTMRINVTGDLKNAVSAKDLILYIIAKLGTEGATGCFVEYTGEVIKSLSMEERMTVCNMSIEMGARGGLIGVDNKTIDFVSERIQVLDSQKREWLTLNSDENSVFDKVVSINANLINPIITCGTSPDTGVAINQIISSNENITEKALSYMGFEGEERLYNKPLDYVFIGSCTNGRIEDIRAVANIIKGKKKASNITAWVVPGSQKVKEQAITEGLDKVILAAGFEFRDPGCSACLAMNDDKIPFGALCMSTSNRNFEGRQGDGARTILSSPITAAISAIMGKVTDPTPYLN